MISQAAIDLIVSCEVTSRKVYEARYQRPEWPGGASGVTIGIGYDLGYATAEKVEADWSGRVSPRMLDAMKSCVGIKGANAKSLLPHVRSDILIPWDDAIAVFMGRDIPQWTRTVCSAIPGAENLLPDCLGALVSLAYNRGASFKTSGDRYTEMRLIRAHVMGGQPERVPDDIRAMKRLWPSVRGLRDRRDAEAALFQKGLTGPPASTEVVVNEAPAEALPPSPAGPAAHGAGGGVAAGTAVAAQQAAAHGVDIKTIAVIVAFGLIVAVVAWLAIHKNAPSQTARQKG